MLVMMVMLIMVVNDCAAHEHEVGVFMRVQSE